MSISLVVIPPPLHQCRRVFFETDQALARSVSPVPSTYGCYSRSRPTSTTPLDFTSFQSFPVLLDPSSNDASYSRLINQLAALHGVSDTPPTAPSIAEDLASQQQPGSSDISRVTSRLDAENRPLDIEAVDLALQKLEGVKMKAGKRRKFRIFPRVIAHLRGWSSGKVNAQILDRHAVSSKHRPPPLTTDTLANTLPVLPSRGELCGKTQQVRRSGSFAGFTTSPPPSPLIFAREGLLNGFGGDAFAISSTEERPEQLQDFTYLHTGQEPNRP